MYTRLGVLALLFTALPSTPAAAPPTARDGAEIRRLVGQLGSDDYATRQKVIRSLLEHGEAARPALEQALRSPDIEVRRRAQRLLTPLDNVRKERAVRALLAEVGLDGVGKFVRRMVTEQDHATDESWEAVARLATAAAGRASVLSGKRFTAPVFALDGMEAVRTGERVGLARSKVLLDEGASRFPGLSECIIVCNGPLPRSGIILGCVLLVDGDVRCNHLTDCVVVCSGNLWADKVRNSLVVANGGAVMATGLEDSYVEATGEVTFAAARRSVFVNCKLTWAGEPDCKKIKTDRGVLTLFPFGPTKR